MKNTTLTRHIYEDVNYKTLSLAQCQVIEDLTTAIQMSESMEEIDVMARAIGVIISYPLKTTDITEPNEHSYWDKQ